MSSYDFLHSSSSFTTNELHRLKDMLEEAGIPFEYQADYLMPKDLSGLSDETIRTLLPLIKGDRIAYPNDEHVVFSAIEDVFSYGAADDRLECMSKLIGDDPLGDFTAEEAFAMIESHYKDGEEIHE